LVLLEVMIATVLAAVGLVCLIRLHLASMAWLRRLEQTVQATSVAMDAIARAQVEGLDCPRTGQVIINGNRYQWHLDLRQMGLPEQQTLPGLEAIDVTVTDLTRSSPLASISSAVYVGKRP